MNLLLVLSILLTSIAFVVPARAEDCLLNPCQNGGVCRSISSVVSCICPSSFTGSRCETPVPPPAKSALEYNYYKLTITKLRDCPTCQNGVQVAEIRFYDANGYVYSNSDLNVFPINSQSPSSQTASKAFDGLLSTKWVDKNFQSQGKSAVSVNLAAPLQLSPPLMKVARYQLCLANDTDFRDPTSWKLEGSTNGLTWSVLDTQTDFFAASFPRNMRGGCTRRLCFPNVACPSPCDMPRCANDGVCVHATGAVSESQDALYSCACDLSHFAGTRCEWAATPSLAPTSTNACNESPCLNGGLCHVHPTDAKIYQCECAADNSSYGMHCEYLTRSRNAVHFPRYRLSITEIRMVDHEIFGCADCTQLSEVHFYDEGGMILAPSSVEMANPGGEAPTTKETVDRLTDGSLDTKWVDVRFGNQSRSVLLFSLKTASSPIQPIPSGAYLPFHLQSYQFCTANDYDQRDPVSWQLDAWLPTGFMVNNQDVMVETGRWLMLESRQDDPTMKATSTAASRRFCVPSFCVAGVKCDGCMSDMECEEKARHQLAQRVIAILVPIVMSAVLGCVLTFLFHTVRDKLRGFKHATFNTSSSNNNKDYHPLISVTPPEVHVQSADSSLTPRKMEKLPLVAAGSAASTTPGQSVELISIGIQEVDNNDKNNGGALVPPPSRKPHLALSIPKGGNGTTSPNGGGSDSEGVRLIPIPLLNAMRKGMSDELVSSAASSASLSSGLMASIPAVVTVPAPDVLSSGGSIPLAYSSASSLVPPASTQAPNSGRRRPHQRSASVASIPASQTGEAAAVLAQTQPPVAVVSGGVLQVPLPSPSAPSPSPGGTPLAVTPHAQYGKLLTFSSLSSSSSISGPGAQVYPTINIASHWAARHGSLAGNTSSSMHGTSN